MVRAIKLHTIQSAERNAYGPLLLRRHGRPPNPAPRKRYEMDQPCIPLEQHRTSSTTRPTANPSDAKLETAVPAKRRGPAIEWTPARRARVLGDFIYNGMSRIHLDALAGKVRLGPVHAGCPM